MGSTKPAKERNAALDRAHDIARAFLDSLPNRPVGPRSTFESLVQSLGGPLPESGDEPARVIEALNEAVEPGLVGSAGPRYFGFVIGGGVPAALAADWLTGTWDQNAALNIASPAAAAVEAVVAEWIKELLGLPMEAGVGFVTGCQMANFSALLAGRHGVLAKAGWDVEELGLQGAPEVHVVIGEEAHATVLSALRLLGLGEARAVRVAADGEGRMIPGALKAALAPLGGPILVAAQAGNVSTGAFDPLDEIAAIAHAKEAWLHVDGAFGLWAATDPARRGLLRGVEDADSWATDAHKWLNVPYDSGIVIVKDRTNLNLAITKSAAYLIRSSTEARDNHDFTPESSRRARGFAIWAALKSLGRAGVSDMVNRCCALALRMAARLREGGVIILNDVVLNQVLARFTPRDGRDPEAFNRAVVARIQSGGVTWASGTRRHGAEALRISVSNWSTTAEDIDRSADAILAAVRDEDRLA
ncbi:MAG: aspartate aminotransferase family protein [Vicinamibacteria bacterium]|nr:aspartate aminotransferase family protein [Vicinamibacteria bacterium]